MSGWRASLICGIYAKSRREFPSNEVSTAILFSFSRSAYGWPESVFIVLLVRTDASISLPDAGLLKTRCAEKTFNAGVKVVLKRETNNHCGGVDRRCTEKVIVTYRGWRFFSADYAAVKRGDTQLHLIQYRGAVSKQQQALKIKVLPLYPIIYT